MVELGLGELRNLVEVLGTLVQRLDLDGVLEHLAVDNGLGGIVRQLRHLDSLELELGGSSRRSIERRLAVVGGAKSRGSRQREDAAGGGHAGDDDDAENK